MIVPFSVSDFIERAAAVYGDRTGVLDEPDQPAASLGRLTYAELHALAQRQAARLDEMGIEVGDRVAVLSHNSARLLTSFFGVCGSGRVLVPINYVLGSRFTHDPALDIPPLPALAACEALDGLPADQKGFALATLLRGRNRVAAAYRDAARLVDAA